MEPDFSGYATKAGLKCTDGRTIMPDAFKHMDGMRIPIVWQHGHDDPEKVLGHAILQARIDGMYINGYFNGTKQGRNAKALVEHKDIESLSIWANQLVERAKNVFHGMIREVSLVLSGANPGAKIDYVRVAHSDGDVEILSDEAIIYTGLPLQHGSGETQPIVDDALEVDEKDLEHATVKEVYDSMTEEQQDLVNFMIDTALKTKQDQTAEHSDADKSDDNEGDLNHKEGSDVTSRNVFEQGNNAGADAHVLTHDAMRGILTTAFKNGGTFKAAVQEYALAHGIDNIDVLFPDAKTLTDRPEFNKRRTEWVAGVINGVRHSPFSRVKSLVADLTQEAARAKGYIKGEFKKEEWFNVTRRVTTPATVYKKQKLDRDDIIDITDFDVVAWMKFEMRIMIEEEIARAILIGDGRDPGDEDKIKDPGNAAEGAGIRAIVSEHELYATTVNVNIGDANSDYNEVVETILRARRFYKGTGSPTFYTTAQTLVEMLLSKDSFGRRRWNSVTELAASLMVSTIVEVEVMEDVPDLLGIVVNLTDYNVGADRGGELNNFDQFDIDYNQMKYLIETRIAGALVKIKAALIIRKTTGTNVLVDPITEPTFVSATGVVTIPTQTGVVYKNNITNATLTAGAQSALAAGATLEVRADAATGYYFITNAEDQWSFTRPAA